MMRMGRCRRLDQQRRLSIVWSPGPAASPPHSPPVCGQDEAGQNHMVSVAWFRRCALRRECGSMWTQRARRRRVGFRSRRLWIEGGSRLPPRRARCSSLPGLARQGQGKEQWAHFTTYGDAGHGLRVRTHPPGPKAVVVGRSTVPSMRSMSNHCAHTRSILHRRNQANILMGMRRRLLWH